MGATTSQPVGFHWAYFLEVGTALVYKTAVMIERDNLELQTRSFRLQLSIEQLRNNLWELMSKEVSGVIIPCKDQPYGLRIEKTTRNGKIMLLYAFSGYENGIFDTKLMIVSEEERKKLAFFLEFDLEHWREYAPEEKAKLVAEKKMDRVKFPIRSLKDIVGGTHHWEIMIRKPKTLREFRNEFRFDDTYKDILLPIHELSEVDRISLQHVLTKLLPENVLESVRASGGGDGGEGGSAGGGGGSAGASDGREG